MSSWDRGTGRQWDYDQLVEKPAALAVDVKKSRQTNEEVPILRRINEKTRTRHSAEQMSKDSIGASIKLSPKDPSIGLSTDCAP
jgi:DNA-binding protein H-NS